LPVHGLHENFRVDRRSLPWHGETRMRSYVPAYEMEAPRDLATALERMAREPGVWRPFAGGTDLMVLLEAGKLPHRKFVSIWDLPELRGIEVTPAHIMLGALTTYTVLRRDEIIAREFPLLCQAAAETGSIATQNRGTLGEISRTRRPPPTRRPHSLCTTQSLNWFPRAARAGFLITASGPAISRRTCAATN